MIRSNNISYLEIACIEIKVIVFIYTIFIFYPTLSAQFLKK